MQEIQTMPKEDLFCNQYRSMDGMITPKQIRTMTEYRGYRLPSLKLLIGFCFPGHLIKIERNNKELRFDIFLSKNHQEDDHEINMEEVNKFRKYYGKGFNIILMEQSDENESD